MKLAVTAHRCAPALKGRANLGRCVICDRRTLFVEYGPWLRKDYRCARCYSQPRDRALIVTLDREFPEWRRLHVHETSPNGPAATKIRREATRYTSGKYPAEDLESLALPDDSVDLFITEEILEHVLRPDLAVREIARVLRPGGAHVFTVPVYRGRTTVARVAPDGTQLEPADYHGPWLVVHEWGDDFTEFVDGHSGLKTQAISYHDRRLGLDGEFLEVFITAKSE